MIPSSCRKEEGQEEEGQEEEGEKGGQGESEEREESG